MIALDVLKLIARLAWAVFRCCSIIFIAIVLGGFRGASKASTGSRAPRD